jgi:hypothetical protein
MAWKWEYGPDGNWGNHWEPDRPNLHRNVPAGPTSVIGLTITPDEHTDAAKRALRPGP